ncbi:MAG: type II secretion system F family protein [Opitutaceae bacterium]|nr:type II secretion system F family protein [Opitutaceae bacterium]
MEGPRTPVAIPPAATPASLRRRWMHMPIGPVAGPRAVALFTRQLATMLRAGLPLLRALELLARQERTPAFKDTIETIAGTIRSGGALSDALARHPRVFDRLALNMVRAGEASGKLDLVLERLARFQEKALHLRGRIRAAMVYPVIVLTFAVVILVALLVFVVPIFQKIFHDLLRGAPLPALTQSVLDLSAFIQGHWFAAAGLVVAAGLVFRGIRRTRSGARWFDLALLRLPPFGGLLLKSATTRLARTLGTLLASGVPILPALLLTRETIANTRIREALTLVHDRVREGGSVADPLDSVRIFPPMVVGLIEVGEHTGRLPAMLDKIADTYDEEVDNAVAGLTSLIEPVIIVLLAVVVGTIVVAILLPIVRIVQMLS